MIKIISLCLVCTIQGESPVWTEPQARIASVSSTILVYKVARKFFGPLFSTILSGACFVAAYNFFMGKTARRRLEALEWEIALRETGGTLYEKNATQHLDHLKNELLALRQAVKQPFFELMCSASHKE